MRRESIIEMLESVARLLELRGENAFKVRAYAQAARVLERLEEDPAALALQGRLSEVPGIGKAIEEKVVELVRTGRLAYHDALREGFPAGLFDLFDLSGLGPKKVKALHDALGIGSIGDLEAACRDGRVAGLPGFGERSAEKILEAIARRREYSGQVLPCSIEGEARMLVDALCEHPAVSRAALAGSHRRAREVLHDIDIVVATAEADSVIGWFAALPPVGEVVAKGSSKCSVRLRSGVQCDLRAVRNEEYPFALAYFTGSKEHNIRMRARALERGWTLNEYRLAPVEVGRARRGGAPGPIPEVNDEGDLYAALGLQVVPPELREDRGEIEAAEAGALPRLIELENLRGTFHCHTRDSDGSATLEEMAEAAADLGLQYLGVADHSRSSVQANGLDARRLEDQIARVADWNARRGDEVRLFAGLECDILKDGALDFPDEILGRLDYVVASVHSSFGMSEAEMTARVLRAMGNRHVTMLGHPTGRLLLARDGYRIDLGAVIDAAAETGTVIELNCNPRRMDLDWRWWPRARERGVRCTINPDAHSTGDLGYLRFGVGAARKGWLTRGDVINCLPLGEVEAALWRKRGPRAG